ncbi:Hypothetical predicted protein [Lecanosticta acicola]|uniref:SnoaL-like domain-containing protein n=1 Tax=Lecanosticta acicola TaxID=111012 RepID=A0AAI8YUC4_9PEZI|nr:Hypothetical predicted protein [Lecanosticta acicola]
MSTINTYPVQHLRPTQRADQRTDRQHTHPHRPTGSSTVAEIIEYIEGLVRTQVQTVNDRDFDFTSPIWQEKASFWRAEIGLMSDKTLTLTQWVDSWRLLDELYPDYYVKILDMTSTVNEADRSAEVYGNIQIEGMPLGLIRSAVGIASFGVVQGKWVAVKHKTISGFDDKTMLG